jgi:cardiolipin synthase (CMP-forming)
VSVADYLSLARIPLGVVFLFVAHDTALALIVLVAAGVSDVLDGWFARRRPADARRPRRGDWLDPLCDKLFVGAVVAGLYLARRPPTLWLALLVTREVLQLVAVTALRLVPTLHRLSRDYDFRANPLGKATTVVQFFAAAALLVAHPMAGPVVWLAAGMGLVSVFTYVRRLGVPKWVN